MGRPELPVDPTGGPVQRFAFELRKLRREAGGPTYRQMSRRVPFSLTTLSQAAAGERFPSLAVALAYAEACGGDRAEWKSRWQQVREELAAQAADDSGEESPYQGLARFEPTDSERFFGRGPLVTAAGGLVREHRFAAVFGPSGSGKSSLLRAGLVPLLRAPGSGLVTLRVLTPGAHPLRDRGRALVPAEGDGDTFLVVDQFEEVFTLCRDTAERAAFIDRLVAARDPDSRLRVVIAVRADFYARCAEHRALADALSDAALLVGPMTPAELRQAVVGPAQGAGLIVERELTARLVADVADEPGGLPLLSHALRETWRRREGRTLTVAAYEAAGGAHGAIARTAEDILARWPEERRELARLVLLRLIAPGEGSDDTRRPVRRAELGFGDPDEIALVVDDLARARLLTLDDDTVDLAHEALITAWPRLTGWVRADRDRLRAHRLLTEAARTWQELGRDPGALYRGARLATAEEYFTEPAHLTGEENAFLTAGREARTTERRRRHALFALLATVAVLALLAGTVAWQESRTGDRRHTEAEARRVAKVAEGLRHSDPRLAVRLSIAAWRLADTTETRSALLGAVAQPERDALEIPGIGSDEGSRHLTADGRSLVVVEPDRIERWDLRTSRRTHSRPGPGELLDAVDPVLSPDGRLLALPGGPEAEVWDVEAGRTIHRIRDALAVTFAPDSRRAVVETGEAEGNVSLRIMDLRTGAPLGKLTAADSESPPSAVFSGDGRRLGLCFTDTRPLEIWDVASRTRLHTPWVKRLKRTGHCAADGLSLTPDGRVALLTTRSGVRRFDLGSHRELPQLSAGSVIQARVSPDGAFLTTVSSDEMLLWRLSLPEAPVFRHALVNELASDVTLDPGARAVRYLNSSGTHVRSLGLGEALTARWTEDPLVVGQLSPDGRTFAQLRLTGAERGLVLRDTRTARVTARPPGPPCVPRMVEEEDSVSDPELWGPTAGETRYNASDCVDFLRFSGNGRFLAYGRAWPFDGGDESDGEERPERQRITVWDVAGRRIHTTVEIPPEAQGGTWGIVGYALSTDGRRLFVAMGADTTEIWDVSRPGRARRTGALRVPQGDLIVRPDGATLVTDRGLVVDTRSGRVSYRALSDDSLYTMAFSRRGEYLAVGGDRIVIWDGDLRERVAALPGIRIGAALPDAFAGVTVMAFSPDADVLAVAGMSGIVQLWDIASGTPLGTPLATPGDPVVSLAFSPDGRTLHTAGRHTGPRRHDVHPGPLAAAACARAGTPLSRAEWRRHLPGLPYRDTC
ncbi:nSTAND1 domain-containing NTPase [Streptomyces yaizuensis]|uniref:DNA-binding protein n=1 Tax=Streptomyces yaizuensis TaxID=2989713 RepID=A0ABQ5P5R4_9ACTN|nr:DNA-binding protein [Streptomyces sp. YSPA8]GLF97937.1 DNA-binding protein [Streptomyces sp. YSPA8]